MRSRKASYWITLLYNGVVCGIWPAAAIAYIVTSYLHNGFGFIATFVVALYFCVIFFMWLFHAVILPRRKRQNPAARE